jgi:hypothetical protein
MKKNFTILLLLLILTGCQNNITQPIQQTSDYLTGKVQIEQGKQAEKTLAMVKCQEFCQTKISTDGNDFDRGPCLSNAIVPDWVCDIAHSPRLPIDDEANNQCSAYASGRAHHFVEVDGNCNLIRAN